MNIHIANNFYESASAAYAAGDKIGAARLHLAAQRTAFQCKAARRESIWHGSHLALCGRIIPEILKSEACEKVRGEAGRIKSESLYMYMRGL